MSCSRARRELLESFALGEELGSGSGPLLAHVESCAQCRRELGIDRELIENMRRALRQRVQGSAPSEASWGLVRRRTVDRPVRPVRVVHWRGMVSAAAAAGMMLFAVATAPDTTLLPVTQSPSFASAARRVVPPLEEARPPEVSSTNVAPQKYPPPGWPMQTHFPDEAAAGDVEPPIPGLMR